MTRRTSAEILQAKKERLQRYQNRDKIKAEMKRVDEALAKYKKKRGKK